MSRRTIDRMAALASSVVASIAHPFALDQAPIRQQSQHPAEYRPVRLQIYQPPRPRDRRVIRRLLRDPDAHKLPQCQRIGQTPCDASLAVDALEITDQTASGNKSPAPDLAVPSEERRTSQQRPSDELIELFLVKKLIQPLVKRMTW